MAPENFSLKAFLVFDFFLNLRVNAKFAQDKKFGKFIVNFEA